jgi:hypothetical protein
MPSDDGIVVLGIDLDGVCANFDARMRQIAAEWFDLDIETYGIPALSARFAKVMAWGCSPLLLV